MKSLTVYVKDSHFKYFPLYEDYVYEIDKDNILKVYYTAKITGEEYERAAFRSWDYYLIDEEFEV